ncbi:uncharacterized protein NFIA_092170 [Aspergillus fischeri NRRL 181]|uniref:Uncharacterized protein n=1 Tax=Neosartorya fischeri (strain ATCC 1020 / DSM 3700 / CBS 544.65 / FGSC A1164 / JCM 1740 / NRRL 181 / WB 181) TaxID=331117 RepID=A1DIP9_NEOFI|nr:uncharacterized protein NFIA_092170 [Aspergillus fischeri NRRL 181]EAW19256.1 hypothetical protein NFIA_092170 [Aspergillus fischeri NRRL 181]KAG2010922.1 hypothetical protein GB937_007466 [Aspergillus fischeri]
MSHKPGGYFYYRYTYMCPWTDTAGQSGTDNTYHSAVYTPVRKQDHTAQTTWYNNTAMPAVKADIEKNFYGDADRNRQGRVYERYNQHVNLPPFTTLRFSPIFFLYVGLPKPYDSILAGTPGGGRTKQA